MAKDRMPLAPRQASVTSGVSANPLPNLNGIAWHTRAISAYMLSATRDFQSVNKVMGQLAVKEDERMVRDKMNGAKRQAIDLAANFKQTYQGADAKDVPELATKAFDELKQSVLEDESLSSRAREALSQNLDTYFTAQYGDMVNYTIDQLGEADKNSREEAVGIATDELIDSGAGDIVSYESYVREVQDNFSNRPQDIQDNIDKGFLQKLETDAYADPAGTREFFKKNKAWFKQRMGAGYVKAQKVIESAIDNREADANRRLALNEKQRKINERRANEEFYEKYSKGEGTIEDIDNSDMSITDKMHWRTIYKKQDDDYDASVQDDTYAEHMNKAITGDLDDDALLRDVAEGKLKPEKISSLKSINKDFYNEDRSDVKESIAAARSTINNVLQPSGTLAPKNPEDVRNTYKAIGVLNKALKGKSQEEILKLTDPTNPDNIVDKILNSFQKPDSKRLKDSMSSISQERLDERQPQRSKEFNEAEGKVNGKTSIEDDFNDILKGN